MNLNSPWDHGRKRAKYAEAGVPAYRVVDVKALRVVVSGDPKGDACDRHETYPPGESIPVIIDGDAPAPLPVSEIFPPLEPTPP